MSTVGAGNRVRLVVPELIEDMCDAVWVMVLLRRRSSKFFGG